LKRQRSPAFGGTLAALAAELKIHLIAGMTEAAGDARYNTCVLIGSDGKLLGKYRKQKLEHELLVEVFVLELDNVRRSFRNVAP
jgi:predicted amidohydrolase